MRLFVSAKLVEVVAIFFLYAQRNEIKRVQFAHQMSSVGCKSTEYFSAVWTQMRFFDSFFVKWWHGNQFCEGKGFVGQKIQDSLLFLVTQKLHFCAKVFDS